MDLVRLRFEARQYFLRAVHAQDPAEIARLLAEGTRHSALADEKARTAISPAPAPSRPKPGA